MVAVELEVMAKKFDRFGWDRDRGSAAHDRMITDWMDALQDFPLDEVKAACRAAVLENPNRMPNEGHIRSQIMAARKRAVQGLPKPEPEYYRPPSPTAEEKARVSELLASAGFAPKRFDGAPE
jgi:hypothetical protein